MKEIKIAKSWFFSAGDKYGWVKDGMEKQGVGISKEALQLNEELVVEVDRVKFYVRCKEALAFIKKYSSRMKVQGRWIGIVSKSVLEEIK